MPAAFFIPSRGKDMALTLLFRNQAQTTLAGAITSTSLTANLSPGSGALFPSPGANQYFIMVLNDAATGLLYEEVWVTNVSGDTITMIRGQEGSTAKNWSAGDIAFNGWTAGSANNLVQASQAQTNALTYALDTGGAANTYSVALTPSMPTGVDGAIVYFKPAHTNTGASTLTVNTGTSYSLLGTAQLPLQGGEILANGFAAAEFNSTLGAYVLLYCTGGKQQVVDATQSHQAMSLGQVVTPTSDPTYADSSVNPPSTSWVRGAMSAIATGRLIGVQVFTASGTYTPTPGTKSVIVEVQGGGGAGGGTVVTGAAQCSIGGGGGAGAYAMHRMTSGFAGAAVVVGAGGLGVASASGGNGGASSFGGVVSAPGGNGGPGEGQITAPAITGGGGSSAVATGGNIFNAVGGNGNVSIALSNGSTLNGGAGGASRFGGGALNSTGNAGGGNAAVSYGAGGSGTASGQSWDATPGGNGKSGIVIVWEYA